MIWQEIVQIAMGGGQVLLLGLLIWLVYTKVREQRTERDFQRRMDERTAALHEWAVRRMADVAMPEKDGKHE